MLLYFIIGILLLFVVLLVGEVVKQGNKIKQLQMNCESYYHAYIKSSQEMRDYKLGKNLKLINCKYVLPADNAKTYMSHSALVNSVKNKMMFGMANKILNELSEPKVVVDSNETRTYTYTIRIEEL